MILKKFQQFQPINYRELLKLKRYRAHPRSWREVKLIKKRGEVSRVKLKFRLTNAQGVDTRRSAADKIIVVSHVSWSISLNGWMQPNEARRRITSTPYLSSLLKYCRLISFQAGKSPVFRVLITSLKKFFPFSLSLGISSIRIVYTLLYNTIIIFACIIFLSPLLKKFFSIFLNFCILDVATRRDNKEKKKFQTSK